MGLVADDPTVRIGPRRRGVGLLALALAGAACPGSDADGPRPVRVAVAGNFAAPLSELVRRFGESTGIPIEASIGATGQLYTQIENGAPFHVFLAADDERPRLLEASGRAVRGSRFPYGIGRLVLYAPSWDSVSAGDAELRRRTVRHLAIANPRTAPYGLAARETLVQWGLWDTLQSRIIRGENVGQAFQFVESRAAEAGLVALSQVVDRERHRYWVVPSGLHDPIRQSAVLLRHGASHPGARAFVEFLQGDEARGILAEFGYALP